MDDETLYGHMDLALARGLPVIDRPGPVRSEVIAIVASGPKVATQLDTIREAKKTGTKIVAVRGAHDWLIAHDIIPDYALTIDPLPDSWHCFELKRPDIHYMIASQCHPNIFDHLADMFVQVWNPLITKDQKRPKGMLIGGGTTSGLRAIAVFYVLGYRKFALFGFDSCMDGQTLRIDGSGKKDMDPVNEVRIERDGESFYCTPAMALQADQFQSYYDWIPDAEYFPFGGGLIPAIIRKRNENAKLLLSQQTEESNGRVSFIHSGIGSASYRYRAVMPAKELGASLNDLTASTLIFSKPGPDELMEMAIAKQKGKRVIVDFCDDHFDWMHYTEALKLADAVVCSTVVLAKTILDHGYHATIVPDAYEFPLEDPHCYGLNLLWFGHAVNADSIRRIMPELEGYRLRIVSNMEGAIPWSHAAMVEEFKRADFVVMPATADYKSANRTVEALRQGCFVIAEPHPSLMEIPGIYIGNIKEGLEWLKMQPLKELNRRISLGQSYVTANYSPTITTAMWRTIIQSPTISEVAVQNGKDGSTLIPQMVQT